MKSINERYLTREEAQYAQGRKHRPDYWIIIPSKKGTEFRLCLVRRRRTTIRLNRDLKS